MSKDLVESMQVIHQRLCKLEARALVPPKRVLNEYWDASGSRTDADIRIYDNGEGPRGNMTGVHVTFGQEDDEDPDYIIKFGFLLFMPGHSYSAEEVESYVQNNFYSIVSAAKKRTKNDLFRKLDQYEDQMTHISCRFKIYGDSTPEHPAMVYGGIWSEYNAARTT
jgi:hypothetical protein